MTATVLPAGVPGSFLTDKDIRAALPHLFASGTTDHACVRHASYELRLGATVKVCPYISPAGEKVWDFKETEWQKDPQGALYVEIQPKQTAHLYTSESFRFTACATRS
jgi:deoxycytidine triphosphate deaminase